MARNRWIEHVMATRQTPAGAGKSFKEILKLAKKTYKRSPSVGKKNTARANVNAHDTAINDTPVNDAPANITPVNTSAAAADAAEEDNHDIS